LPIEQEMGAQSQQLILSRCKKPVILKSRVLRWSLLY